MKRIKQILLFVLVLCCISCKNNNLADANASTGDINEVSIVISDVLWNGEVGDSLRKKLAAPVDGLPQEEPQFTLNQFHDKSFEGTLKKGRNIIIIDKGEKKDYKFKENRFCTSQNVFTITGMSVDELLEMLEMHSEEVISTIKKTEIAEYQARNAKAGLLDSRKFASRYDISIKVPSSYSYAVQNTDFFWLKKDIPSGSSNILIYKVPYSTIEKNKDIVNNIIHMRDSVGSVYVHGQDPGTFMVTEEAYAPYLFMTSLNDKRAFETRGNWEMEDDFMSGPFLNYAIRDDQQHGYLIIEGFVNTSSPKRDLIVELESIIKSVKFL
jgi:hypothetical protein